jgi:hypothetical protein
MKTISPLKPLIAAMFVLAAATAGAQVEPPAPPISTVFSPVVGPFAVLSQTFTTDSAFQAFTFFGSHLNDAVYANLNYSYSFFIESDEILFDGAAVYGNLVQNTPKTGWTYSGFSLGAGTYTATLGITYLPELLDADMLTVDFSQTDAGNGYLSYYTSSESGTISQVGAIGNLGYSTVSAVPEPESYAMLLAGLGLMGAIARRRSRKI